MSITGTTNGLNAGISGLASDLGYNSWQLVDGKYNGCTFTSFVQFGIAQANQLVQQGENVAAIINQLFGSNIFNTDPNGFGQLFNTILSTIQFEDNILPQIAEKRIPFSSQCNLEDMGFAGREFKLSLFYFGNNYQKALGNFINAWLNPPSLADNYRVLIHPTLGQIPGETFITEFQQLTTWEKWNACLVNVTFRSEITDIGLSGKTSNTQQILNAIQSLLSLIGAINTGLNVAGIIGNSFAGQVNNTVNSLFNSANFIYKNGNLGVYNSTFATAPIDFSKIPVSLNQNPTYNDSMGNVLMNAYVKSVNNTISQIQSSNVNGLANNLINNLNSSITALYNLVNLAINTNNKVYTTPYDMTLMEVLAYNSIGFEQAQSIMALNPNLVSTNYIPKGTQVYV